MVQEQEEKGVFSEKKDEPSALQNAKNTTAKIVSLIKAGVWNGPDDPEDILPKVAFGESLLAMCMYFEIAAPPALLAIIAIAGVKNLCKGSYTAVNFLYSHAHDCIVKKTDKNENDAETVEEKNSAKLAR